MNAAPLDQAQGLRRLFPPRPAPAPAVRLLPVVANPHAVHCGAVLERLCAAFAELGLHTLLVDAGEPAPASGGLDRQALAARIEHLAPQLSYLPAGGLARRYADARASTPFLHALAEAAPQTDVLIVHAGAAELCRLFAQVDVRPLLLADDHPSAVTHAYASLKLLASQAGWMSHDLLLTAATGSPRAARIAERLSRCADAYLGAVLHDWARVDPSGPEAPGTDLRRMVRAQLHRAGRAGPPDAAAHESAFAPLDAHRARAEPATPAYAQ